MDQSNKRRKEGDRKTVRMQKSNYNTVADIFYRQNLGIRVVGIFLDGHRTQVTERIMPK